MRNRLAFRHWFRAFASLAFFALVLCLAFYITAFVYARTGWKPHAVLALLVNAFLGIILMVALVAIAGTVIHRRHRTKNPSPSLQKRSSESPRAISLPGWTRTCARTEWWASWCRA